MRNPWLRPVWAGVVVVAADSTATGPDLVEGYRKGMANRGRLRTVQSAPSTRVYFLSDAQCEFWFRTMMVIRPRAGGAGKGAAGTGRTDRRRARNQPQRRVEFPDAQPAPVGAHGLERLHRRQRHAVRLRARGADRTDGRAARPGRLGHQQWRQHGRRHPLFGHRRRRQRRLSVRHPAIAFSLAEKGWEHIESAARAARQVVERHLVPAPPVLLNVNIPNRRFEDLHASR